MSYCNVSDNDCDSPIPTVNERLGQLRPSRELLEYYRKKVAQFDDEHEEMIQRMDNYKVSYEEQHKMETELTQREQEIVDLQKAISDLQVCVLQEREQVLRLYAENDRLKIREVNDKRRIQHLLAIAGPAASEVSYFHKEPPSKIVIPQRLPKAQMPNEDGAKIVKKQTNKAVSRVETPSSSSPQHSCGKPCANDDTLALQVEALQAQLEEQTKLARDQVSSLLEERRILQEESDLARERDQDRYERYATRLKNTQNLLHESTQEILNLKRENRQQEKQWMSEKDRLLQEMDVLREQLDSARRSPNRDGRANHVTAAQLASACVGDYEARQQLEAEIGSLEQQVEQGGKLADMYREQCIQAEDELARVREETDVHRNIFKERTEKMSKRLELMTVRYAALEKRRGSEVEGFKTDIKNLRKRLKDVEKQLYKVSVGGAVSDVEVLQTVHATAGRSRAIQNELKTLKSKLYTLEGDLRGIY